MKTRYANPRLPIPFFCLRECVLEPEAGDVDIRVVMFRPISGRLKTKKRRRAPPIPRVPPAQTETVANAVLELDVQKGATRLLLSEGHRNFMYHVARPQNGGVLYLDIRHFGVAQRLPASSR